MSVFSENLRKLRGDSSQAQMASELGMKQQQYARYEKGVTAPGIDVLERICRIHDCSADKLLGLKDMNKSVKVDQRGNGNISQIGNGNTAADCSNCASKQLADLMKQLGITVADLASIAAKKSAARLPRKR